VTELITSGLLVLVTITAIGTVQIRNLYGATILLGIYSLLMALSWSVMQALDVAFTEAAVGAGISTVLLFAALVRTGARENEKPRRELNAPAFLAVLATGALLLYGTGDMPRVGTAETAVNSRAGKFYMSAKSEELTHAPNMVTAVLASYRGYDTLFETAVIFTAGVSMILLLRKEPGQRPRPRSGRAVRLSALRDPREERETSGRLVRPREPGANLSEQDVMSTISKVLIFNIVIFGIYVITHGELGPGGGFQGGVIVAAAYILTALVFGPPRARELMPEWLSDRLPAVGVLIYAGVGVATLALGAEFLNYDAFGTDHARGQMIGMTIVELGVGLTVASVMITVFNEVIGE
jgi:multicomponent Na+:H+ antiporter subunit B